MNAINELRRLPSPAPRPQPIAFDGDTLWMGSWDTTEADVDAFAAGVAAALGHG